MDVPGYAVTEVLSTSAKTRVYAAIAENPEGTRVALKTHGPPHCTAQLAARYEREFHILKQLDASFAVRPIELIRDGNQTVLVMEEVTWGKTLAKHLSGGHLSVEQTLKVAIQLLRSVGVHPSSGCLLP